MTFTTAPSLEASASSDATEPERAAAPRRAAREAGSMQTVDLGADGGKALRRAFARFATGVTVVTASSPLGRVAVTANSFSSVSLDPPLALWSLARASRRYERFAAAEHMAVHVLADAQRDVCDAFARSGEAFDCGLWRENAEGVPILEGCLARFECRKYAAYDGGDHVIFVAEVLRAASSDAGDPLLFHGGAFGRFAKAA